MRNDARTRISNRRTRRARQAGQSLIVAVIVLFLLMFLGGVFVALVARNLRNAQRGSNVSQSGGYAEAGLRYMDEQLLTSPQGADWRPVPEVTPSPADPDYFWIKPYDPATGQGGYSRITFGGSSLTQRNAGGRALIKVEYRPAPGDPNSKYLKLISIGRSGVIDPQDPTTFGNTDRSGLRRELVAYKAIGITDYVRSIWNKDNKSIDAPLGAPLPAYERGVPQDIVSSLVGPVRVQANLRWYGKNQIALSRGRNDAIEVTGRILLEGVDPTATDLTTQPTQVAVDNLDDTDAAELIHPSDATGFTSRKYPYLVRDGLASETPGAGADPRGVGRIEPPVIDAPTGPNGVTRYRVLTRNSLPMDSKFAPSTLSLNTWDAGPRGWGQGLYLNNRLDVQRESNSLVNAYSLRGDWLQPPSIVGGNRKPNWNGDFYYNPPAVKIEFNPGYMRLAASENYKDRRLFWTETGVPLGGQTQVVRFAQDATKPDPLAIGVPATNTLKGYPYVSDAAGAPVASGTSTEDRGSGDLVIFCEGNVRVSGTIGGLVGATQYERHVTLVSNGTIYIDGPILRNNEGGNTQSSIALLARNYIAVNTTQFQNSLQTTSGNPFTVVGGEKDWAMTLDPINSQFSFSVPNLTGTGHRLFLRHWGQTTTADQTTAVNLYVNGTLFDFNGSGATTWQVPQTDPSNRVLPNGAMTTPLGLTVGAGIDNRLTIGYDASGGATVPYRLGRVAVAPAEVRIEAFMYAQEGSFFIIPGAWFNPNPNDTWSYYNAQTPKRRFTSDDANSKAVTDDEFPFYREPLDVKLIFDGTIAENVPAQIGDQGAWLEKWGRVPTYYGSSANATRYGGQGISYLFNPQAIMPYRNPALPFDASANPAVRMDAYGNILPIVPRLPVAQGLLYQGEATEPLP